MAQYLQNELTGVPGSPFNPSPPGIPLSPFIPGFPGKPSFPLFPLRPSFPGIPGRPGLASIPGLPGSPEKNSNFYNIVKKMNKKTSTYLFYNNDTYL